MIDIRRTVALLDTRPTVFDADVQTPHHYGRPNHPPHPWLTSRPTP